MDEIWGFLNVMMEIFWMETDVQANAQWKKISFVLVEIAPNLINAMKIYVHIWSL